MSSFMRVCFVNLILYRNGFFKFCNLLRVYVHKICEEKFGSCKKLFSWLGQKVNKKIMMPTAWPCAHGHGMTPRPG